MKKSAIEPWMPADEYGRSLRSGLSINLLVRDVGVSTAFLHSVFGMKIVYADDDFAVMRTSGSDFMLHADHTYRDHPMTGVISDAPARGQGAELRLYGIDPDAAEAAARSADSVILAGAMDKPHGQREAYIIDPDGYVWVPGIPLPE
ncbi:MAG: VOC family protein [Pseudomonadota bacterium]